MFALHLIFSIVVAYSAIAFIEYWLHRTFMHHMKVALRLRINFLKQLCHNHMALHHKHSYKHSDDDEHGDSRWQVSLAGLLPNVLICLVLHHFDPLTGEAMFVVGTIYGAVWWAVHAEMHQQKGRFFARTRAFRYIAMRHELHHQFPKTNYNLLFPLWDWVFGTEARAQLTVAKAHNR